MNSLKKEHSIEIVPVFFIILISLLWWRTIFHGFMTIDWYDWPQALSFQELQRIIILKYHQFPFWSPYIGGGEPWLAHPQSSFLSPFFLLILIFGTIKGVIYLHLIQVIIGMLGMYYLSRYYRLNKVISLFNSIVLLNIFNLITFVGVDEDLTISLLPWVILLLKKDNLKKYYFLISLLLVLILYSGAPYSFVMSCMTLTLYLIFNSIIKKRFDLILGLLKVFLFTFLLGSLKIIPMLELVKQYPRIINLAPAKFLQFERLPLAFSELKYFFYSNNNVYIEKTFINNSFAGDEMLGYNFSIFVPILLLASFFLLWKKHKDLLAITIFFIFFGLGDSSPINIYRLMHFLPVFSSLDIGGKFPVLLIPILCLILGLTIEEVRNRLFNLPVTRFIAGLVIIFLILQVTYRSTVKIPERWKDKQISYDLQSRQNNFHQTNSQLQKMFEAIYNNRGAVYGHDGIGDQLMTKVIPVEDKGYRGEYFFSNSRGNIKEYFFSPNKLKFKFELNQDDILLINQNYFPGWLSSNSKVINYNGLIGIPLKSGQQETTVYYLPKYLFIGIVSFLVGVLAFVFVR